MFFLGIIAVSCVPSKKRVYLQEGKELKHRKDLIKDSVIRTHLMRETEYRIQPLDILSINFESITAQEYDFFSKIAPQGNSSGSAFQIINGILVDLEGNVEYPVVGKMNIGGLTIFEAQTKLQEIANQFLKDAVVRIRVLNFRFTVLGEVNGEGVVNSTNTRVTMMEAIGLAGGFSELADRENIKIIRQKGNMYDVFYVNLLEERYTESLYYFVQQNDIIIVPPLGQRTFTRYFASNLSLWSSTLSAILVIVTLINR